MTEKKAPITGDTVRKIISRAGEVANVPLRGSVEEPPKVVVLSEANVILRLLHLQQDEPGREQSLLTLTQIVDIKNQT